MIAFFRSINWRCVWRATEWLLMALGAIALVAWMPQQPVWFIVLGAMALGGIWWLIYRLTCWASIRRRARLAQPRRVAPTEPAEDAPRMVRRFVRTDPDDGHEVYKWEPAQQN